MPISHEPFKPVVTACPFLAQPCVEGDVQGFECRQRVTQAGDPDPLAKFRDHAVIYCAVCKKEITVSTIPRYEARPDNT